MKNDKKEIYVALARKVSSLGVPDEVIESTVEKLAVSKFPIRGIDICSFGICLDYIIDGDRPWDHIRDVVSINDAILKDVRVFPFGIINPDILHVQVQQEILELQKYLK